MSQTRFHMHKGNVMVEHYYRETLESIRRVDPRFRRARIKNVLQMYPSQIRVGVVYERDSKPPKEVTA